MSAATIVAVGAVTAIAVQPDTSSPSAPLRFSALTEHAGSVASLPDRGRRVLTAMGSQLETLGGDFAVNGRALVNGDGSVHELAVPSGGRVFLVVNGPSTCFLEDGLPAPSAGCGRTGDLTEARRLMSSITKESDSSWRVLALLPDGTRAAIVRDDQGSVVPLAAAGNVGVARVKGTPASVSWTDVNGTSHNQTFGADDPGAPSANKPPAG